MAPKRKDPLKTALKALEMREGLQKLNNQRRLHALHEARSNAQGELQRLHGQAAVLPGLAAHLAQRRALAKSLGQKIKQQPAK